MQAAAGLADAANIATIASSLSALRGDAAPRSNATGSNATPSRNTMVINHVQDQRSLVINSTTSDPDQVRDRKLLLESLNSATASFGAIARHQAEANASIQRHHLFIEARAAYFELSRHNRAVEVESSRHHSFIEENITKRNQDKLI